MALSKPVRRIAIVGTGVIGASWAAFYLARGFDVIATDPAPNAEANLRHYVDTAWPALAILGVSQKASPEHLWFTADVRQASADADFVQESAPEQSELKIKLFAEMDRAAPPDSIIASKSLMYSSSVNSNTPSSFIRTRRAPGAKISRSRDQSGRWPGSKETCSYMALMMRSSSGSFSGMGSRV